MFDWRTIKKIDTHIHILPDDVHEANPDSEDAWVHAADLHKYCGMMDRLGCHGEVSAETSLASVIKCCVDVNIEGLRISLDIGVRIGVE